MRLELHDHEIERYPDYLTTDDVCKLVVLPQTLVELTDADLDTDGRSYCSLLAHRWRQSDGRDGMEKAPATHFVSHAWKYSCKKVLDTLEAWEQKEHSANSANSANVCIENTKRTHSS